MLLTFAVGFFKLFGDDMSNIINQLADNGLSISVTLFGFLLTILTLVNSIDTRRMRFVREMGKFPQLISYLRNAIVVNLLLLACSFLIKYVEHRTRANWVTLGNCNTVDYLYLFLFLYTILVSFRFTKIFISLLTDGLNGRT
jgi:hypothetical protein